MEILKRKYTGIHPTDVTHILQSTEKENTQAHFVMGTEINTSDKNGRTD